jgi:fido (protein-threonine AMPylation protein)
VARQCRTTQPVHTKVGLLVSFDELDRLLTEGELRGRAWIHERATAGLISVAPAAGDILDLHGVMFGHVYDWAGSPRTEDLGPGGIVHVHHWCVREELHKLSGDLGAWLSAIKGTEDLAAIARVVADCHHRFQWIHPFCDTNGRTGRALDQLLLWQTFGLAGDSLATSPVLEYFPDDAHKDEYYDGLTEADNRRPEKLQAYYAERITAALEAAGF